MSNPEFKLTNQRLEILNYLKSNYDHPSVDDLFNHIKKKLSRISKKTVYTNLELLSKKGLILELEIKGIKRYEPHLEPHNHLICKSCNKIIDIKSKKLNSYSMKATKDIKDFYVDFSIINFYGICKSCKGGNKNGK